MEGNAYIRHPVDDEYPSTSSLTGINNGIEARQVNNDAIICQPEGDGNFSTNTHSEMGTGDQQREEETNRRNDAVSLPEIPRLSWPVFSIIISKAEKKLNKDLMRAANFTDEECREALGGDTTPRKKICENILQCWKRKQPFDVTVSDFLILIQNARTGGEYEDRKYEGLIRDILNCSY